MIIVDIITGIISTAFIVSNPHSPLCINVGFLFNQPVGTFRDIPLVYDHLDVGEDAHLHDFNGSVRITRTRRGMLFSAQLQATITAECVNCLVEFEQALESEFDELFAFDERSMTDSGLLIPEDGNIDLTPLAREYMLLEMPINPLCRPDCKGLCEICGEDLNHNICEHQKAKQVAESLKREENNVQDTSLGKAFKKALGQSPSA